MVIYRINDGPKLYLRRLVSTHWSLWHADRALALRLEPAEALAVVAKLRQAAKTTQIGAEEEEDALL